MSTDKGIAFFYEHAGYCYGAHETPEEGRQRCAEQLAGAELWARLENYTFEWEQDELDSSEWSDEQPVWPTYVCLMRDEAGHVVQSLGGLDFGTGPYGPYRRVVEAELALEQMGSIRAVQS